MSNKQERNEKEEEKLELYETPGLPTAISCL